MGAKCCKNDQQLEYKKRGYYDIGDTNVGIGTTTTTVDNRISLFYFDAQEEEGQTLLASLRLEFQGTPYFGALNAIENQPTT